MTKLSIDEMTNFCKRRGFVYPSGDLYGGLAGFWDYGPVGVELKNNIKQQWWKFHVHGRADITGIDGSIITNPKVWEASGHVGSFVDVAVQCTKCGTKAKIDKHEIGNVACEKCGGEYETRGEFNPMFTTSVGPIANDSTTAYLRPETAQLIFANFKTVSENARLKLPFGIAQIGKAYRNEIAPRNFLFRCREFEQMEIEYFIDPAHKKKGVWIDAWIKEVEQTELNILSADMQEKGKGPTTMTVKQALDKNIISLPWHAYWLATELTWFFNLGANKKNFRIRQHSKQEKSHYATDTWDIEYHFPFGWKELQGIADRGTYDLEAHEQHSKKDLKILTKEEKKVLPMVVAEPSLGVERSFLVFLFDAYNTDSKGHTKLKLHPKLSPVKVAVFPLVKKDEQQVQMAWELYTQLRTEWNAEYDESGSVGRRYARQDEIGTPYCITIDNDSIKELDATIRERDTEQQKRIPLTELKNTLRKLINEEITFESL